MLEFVKKHVDDYLHQESKCRRCAHKKNSPERARAQRHGWRSKVGKGTGETSQSYTIRNYAIVGSISRMPRKDERHDSTLFITEGDSASGSITKSRNPRLTSSVQFARKAIKLLWIEEKSGITKTRNSIYCSML